VDGNCAEAEGAEHDGDALRVAARAAEYDGAAACKLAADVCQIAVLVGEGHEQVLLPERVHRAVPETAVESFACWVEMATRAN
jgi:hypothetical protein